MAIVIICDICKNREQDSARRRSLVVGRELDAAGDRDDITEIYDLCPECELRVLWIVVGRKSHDLNSKVVANIKKLLGGKKE